MEALSNLSQEMNDLINSFLAPSMIGNDWVGLTQYIFWMCIAIIVLVIVVVMARKRMAIVPKGRFINGFEWLVEYIRNNIIIGVVGSTADKHAPFLLTIFFFIITNNVIGVIPGMKPGTGTIGVTAALALCSFCYFIYVGCKKKGVGGYIKALSPSGIVLPLAIFIGLLEVISQLLRLATLAIRLFANMFAGHICLGAFTIMTSLCFQAIIQNGVAGLGDGVWSIVWFIILLVIYAIEMIVAYVQAYVFTTLSAVYVALAEQDD